VSARSFLPIKLICQCWSLTKSDSSVLLARFVMRNKREAEMIEENGNRRSFRYLHQIMTNNVFTVHGDENTPNAKTSNPPRHAERTFKHNTSMSTSTLLSKPSHKSSRPRPPPPVHGPSPSRQKAGATSRKKGTAGPAPDGNPRPASQHVKGHVPVSGQ